jgi:predicted nucleic acid-binding protein
VRLYAESSAVLAWLLGESTGSDIGAALDGAEFVVASDLTLVECDRALLRTEATGGLSPVRGVELRAKLAATAAHWHVLHVDAPIVDRARRPFPGEPIRTLDALHLATAVTASGSIEELAVLSLDRRVRGSAAQLGMRVVPASRPS